MAFGIPIPGAAAVHGVFGITYEDAPGNDFITMEPGIDFLTRNAWVQHAPRRRVRGGYNSTYARIDER